MQKLFRLFVLLLLSFTTLFSFTASSTLAADSRQSMPQEEPAEVIYVANTSDDCGTFTPCYFNSDEDGEDGIGTGLRKAVLAANQGAEIRILKQYKVKSHTVLIDKEVHIRGHEQALISYSGTDCSNPMLKITKGGYLTNLTINDGSCLNPSRTLIEINSSKPVSIEHNTLAYGNHAIDIHNNTGEVIVAFNHIINNENYAVFRSLGEGAGTVNIYANNIINNGSGDQVNCNNNGTANHNFWGVDRLATANADQCVVSDGKRLGAIISQSSEQPGVEAQRLAVTSTMSYAFDGEIGAMHTSGDDFNIIIVNHGQGASENIPFNKNGSLEIKPCSNFYDVFLVENAVAANLTLALSYNLNPNCVSQIESDPFCGGTDSTKYPLLWYDPATMATDGWNPSGQAPKGPGAGGASGQETTCRLDQKEIRVVIDNSGRPALSSDLSFTPFVVGLPVIDGITLSVFKAGFDGVNNIINWTTSSEINVQGFYILRADSEDGPYARISSQISAIGDIYIGGIYQYTDNKISSFARTYYYKLEVIDNLGNSIETHGPVSVLTATATPTATKTNTPTSTPTITATPTHTRTPFYYYTSTPYYRYPTPTSYYQPRTSTPITYPTPIRSLSPTSGSITYPIDDSDLFPDIAYPDMETPQPTQLESSQDAEGYPLPGTTSPPTLTPSPEIETPATGTDIDEDDALPIQNIRWIFIIVGAAGGLSLLGAVSVILVKSRFS
ncbi:MAG TPA: hypothetical protein PLE10_08335 [Brevefilum sp.]|nr:hypothetical protein [Brevefilum sp.]HOR19812.1 hypothetical protein [Brevefilum sp.]HPL68867.1 hypothetical protein [Brevefilum sp.]